jgi:hypothetical protein
MPERLHAANSLIEHVFLTLRAAAHKSFHVVARNKNLNNFRERPANFYLPATFASCIIRMFTRIFDKFSARKSLMEKTQILNDNHSALRQKRSEPR